MRPAQVARSKEQRFKGYFSVTTTPNTMYFACGLRSCTLQIWTAGYRDYYIPLLWGHSVFMRSTFISCTLAEAMMAVEAQKPTARSVNPHRAARSRGRLHASEGLFKRLEIAITSPCCGVTLYLWCPPSSHVPWLRPCWQ